jgi:hypothetical protein
MLHGMFVFGWSTLIVNFTIQPRLQFLVFQPRYMYHQTSLKLPSLYAATIFFGRSGMLTSLTEARPLILTELNMKTLALMADN